MPLRCTDSPGQRLGLNSAEVSPRNQAAVLEHHQYLEAYWIVPIPRYESLEAQSATKWCTWGPVGRFRDLGPELALAGLQRIPTSAMHQS